MANFTLETDSVLKPIIDKLKETIRVELEKRASEIVRDEVAKVAVDLSMFASFQRLGQDLVITVRNVKEAK